MFLKIWPQHGPNFTIWNIPEKNYDKNTKLTCFKLISITFRNPNFLRAYLQKYNKPKFEIFTKFIMRSYLNMIQISPSKHCRKKGYSKIIKMAYLKLISRAFKNPDFLIAYIWKYRKARYEILIGCLPRSCLNMVQILSSKTSQKKVLAKMQNYMFEIDFKSI